jgi:chromosome segregation ATPase
LPYSYPISSKISSQNSSAKAPPKEKESKKQDKKRTIDSTTDCLAIIQKEGSSSKARRDGTYNKGKAAGIKEAEDKAAREIAVLKSTNDAVHTRILALTEQSSGAATGEYVAITTASSLTVENTQLKNKVAVLERSAEDNERTLREQAAELESLKNTIQAQARDLAALQTAQNSLLGISVPSSSRPSSNPYIRRPY